ncbi:hypothetical protein Hypma_007914 [Hypsizygus marmoreus]|uniref:Uncharacterized protein n=1 Tax=Hypsizygus marmoreus TaxID=39966 RepID=A0A369JS82_HYPMA|nr:hypothetical protein Hypma_007914 [Hypsizygus marmoreus]
MSLETETFTLGMSTLQRDPQPVAPKLLDIHDASRDKIVIRPRCKEFAKTKRRTLACFTSLEVFSVPELSSSRSTTSTGTSSSNSQAVSSPLEPKTRDTSQVSPPAQNDKAMEPEEPKADGKKTKRPSRFGPVITVASGRIEKSPKASPVKHVADTIQRCIPASQSQSNTRYTCTCPDPKRCPRCRLVALADRFCAIVVAREQRLKMHDI